MSVNPRAAHAIVATLVQVTNTTANPAITQDVKGQAAQLVELITVPFTPPGDNLVQLSIELPIGQEQLSYVVPAGQNLVITSADVMASAAPNLSGTLCTSQQLARLTNGSGTFNNRSLWMLAPGQGTAHFVYPSGIVFPSGFAPYIETVGACYTFVALQGYYTAN